MHAAGSRGRIKLTIAWHKSPVVTLEKYNRFVPNLTRLDGQALRGRSKSETFRYG